MIMGRYRQQFTKHTFNETMDVVQVFLEINVHIVNKGNKGEREGPI
jgi:hypothetical protein